MRIEQIYARWFRLALQAKFSNNPFERESLLLGFHEDNGSPFFSPIKHWAEHCFVVGPSGQGKTAALAATLEQFAHRGMHSIILGDLKGDSHELFPAVTVGNPGLVTDPDELAAAAARGSPVTPVKWFTDRVGHSTHTFNLFEQRFWKRLTPMQKAATIGAALGNTHGLSGYGSQWFGGAAFEVMQRVFERAEVQSFRGLAEAIHHLIIHGRRDDLHSDIRAAGLQAYLDTRRLGSVQALNVVGNPHGIDLCGLFETPQVLYLSLPSAVNHDTAGAIFRLFLFALFDAAAHIERRVGIILCADEAQRGLNAGTDVVAQQARSCGIQLILAQQTMADLKTKEKDLGPTLRNCCRIHWQFGEGDEASQLEMAEAGGSYEAVEESKTYGWFSSLPGRVGKWRATATTERVVQKPRLPLEEVKRVCTDPRLSLYTASGDHGLYQAGGLPQVLFSDFHITPAEYARRKALPWPAAGGGCIVTAMPDRIDERPDDEEPPPTTRIGRPKSR